MREQDLPAVVFGSVTAKTAIQISVLWVAGTASVPHAEASGTHLRLRTEHGPVHVWWSSDYDAKSAGGVVYVHGYFTEVDHACKKHHLAEQFTASNLNALFVACEAPDSSRSPVRWTSLLLDEVDAAYPGGVPEGRVTVLGQSRAHRTITDWLDDTRLDTIVLLHALSHDNHMRLVTDGVEIPLLLRALQPPLVEASRSDDAV